MNNPSILPSTTGARNAKQRPSQHQSSTSSLMYAAQQGNVELVRHLLKTQPSLLYIRDRTGKTPLHYCCTSRSITSAQVADLLVMAAPDLVDSHDEDGLTHLHLAVIAGNMPLVTFLLANNADVNALDNELHSVVHWATVCGETEALRAVLAAGASVSTPDIQGGYPLHYAAQMCGGEKESNLGIQILHTLLSHKDIKVSVEDGDGRQPLLWAASAGSAKAILALVKAGSGVEAADKDGLTALHCAASRGHTDCIDTLLTLCGASPDLIDTNGCTALHYAVTLGHADATALLLAHGADPNKQDRRGRSPAHCGCAKGQFETVKMLGAHGANLWLKNARGDLPLHEAARSGRRELVKWLLAMRPSLVNARNNDGRCLLHLAALNDNADMCKVLIDSGAQINPVLRTSRNVFMTPLDCALLRGFRSTAKYLQLQGGVPACRLGKQILPASSAVSLQIRDDVTFWGDTSSDSDQENKERGKSKKRHRRKISQKFDKKHAALSESDRDSAKKQKISSEKNRIRQRIAERKKNYNTLEKMGNTFELDDEEEDIQNVKLSPRNRLEYTNEIIINGKTEINIHQSRELSVSSTREEVGKTIEEKTLSRPKSAKMKETKKAKSFKVETSKKLKSDTPDPRKKTFSEFTSPKTQLKYLKDKSTNTSKEKTVTEGVQTTDSQAKEERKKKPNGLLPDQQSLVSNTSEDIETPKNFVTEAAVHAPPKKNAEDLTISTKKNELAENIITNGETQQLNGKSIAVNQENGTVQKLEQVAASEEGESIDKTPEIAKDDSVKMEVNAQTGKETQMMQEHQKEEKTTLYKEIQNVEEESTKQDEAAKTEDSSQQKDKASSIQTEENNEILVETNTTVTTTETVENVEKTETVNKEESEETTTSKQMESKQIESKQIESKQIESKQSESKQIESKQTTSSKGEDDVVTSSSAFEVSEASKSSKSVKVEKTQKYASDSAETDKDDSALVAVICEDNQQQSESETPDTEVERKISAKSTKKKSFRKESKSHKEEASKTSDSGSSVNTAKTHKSFQVLSEQEAKELESDGYRKKRHKARSPTRKYRSEGDKLRSEGDKLRSEGDKLRSEGDKLRNEGDKLRSERDKPRSDGDKPRSEGDKPSGEGDKIKKRLEDHEPLKRSKIPTALGRTPLSKSDKHLDKIRDKSMENKAPSLPNIRDSFDLAKDRDIRCESNMSAPILASVYSDNERGSLSDDLESSKRGSAARKKLTKKRSKHNEARNAESDYESSILIDSGFELSPRSTKVSRCKPMSDKGVNMSSVTQNIQTNIRRYHLERKIFQHLLDLKRLQIRSGQHNEAMLVKRAIDAYHNSCASTVGAGRYIPQDFTFKSFEKFLYESLRKIQRNGAEYLKGLPETPTNPLFCTQSTNKCMHATHAYTGVPCAAYLPKMDHHTIPKVGFNSCKPGTGGFLPFINNKKAVTLELSHGNEKQIISLPADRLHQNKRYFVTFTVKGSEASTEEEKAETGHRHPKSD